MWKKQTMIDLAREAGCSKSQVSRAIAGKPGVAPELRARVLELASRWNYRNLADNHRPRIVFAVWSWGCAFADRLLNMLEEESERLGLSYACVDRNNFSFINEHFCDGVIAINFGGNNKGWNWGAFSGLPLIIVNGYGRGLDHIPSIDPDREDEYSLVLKHLAGLGHRRIARVYPRNFQDSNRVISRGASEFQEAAAKLKLMEVEDVVYPRDVPLEAVIPPLLDRGITAVYIVDLMLGIPAAECILRTGRRIPEDVSLVSYELSRISEHLDPPHTTLEFDYRTIARRAVAELHVRIKGEGGSPGGAIPIPNILHVRGSTAPPPR